MILSENVMLVMKQAAEYAVSQKLEFITPEVFLLKILENEDFKRAFSECNGNLKLLRNDLSAYIKKNLEKVDNPSPVFSQGVESLLDFAGQNAFSSGCDEICIRHIIHAIFHLPESYAAYFMEKQNVTEADILQVLTDIDDEAFTGFDSEDDDELPFEYVKDTEWTMYAPCLNDTIDKVNPLIGRKQELDRTIQVLCRKDKNNPLHIGEAGVGKTVITYGLVRMIVENKVPDALVGAKVFALDLGGMLAGTQYRGDFEKRFKKVLTEVGKVEKPIIYIDEIHNLCGAGAVGESSLDASNMLKPYLSDGHIRFIGATTFEEYKRYFEKNKSMIRRFQNIEIKEPCESETIQILEGLKKGYEAYHGVKYAKGIMEYAVRMSSKYIHERFQPDKAIDLIDEAGAFRKLHPTEKKSQLVDKAVIDEVLTTICRVPVESVNTDDTTGLKHLEEKLLSSIFGQDEAVSQVVNAVKISKAGLLEENKPLASLLFVGPTGVGKTEIAKCLAKELGFKLIRFDMSEYGEKHAVAKLIGSPAGYVGYEEGGLLTEAIRKNPQAVLLLDEIEKAHSDIYNILLQVMDYATLTDNQGRKADFTNVVIIMTSNAGASLLGKENIGFKRTDGNKDVIMEVVKKTFMPEFRNRLNKVVVFNNMNESMAERIVNKKLSELSSMLKLKNVEFIPDEAARGLLKKLGVSREFGAREIDRVIRNDIKPLFVDDILFGRLKKGGTLTLTAENEKFVVKTAKG